MATEDPNWQDLYNKAKASGDADFEREFEEAVKQTQAENGSGTQTENEHAMPEQQADPEANQETGTQNGPENVQAAAEDEAKISQLREAVDVARKEYLTEEYKKKKTYSQIFNFFGKKDQKNGLEGDMDLAYYRATYDNKLFDLRNVLMEDAKKRGASDQELADIYGGFRVEQKLNVREMHDEVKAEQQEGKAFGVVREGMLKISKNYREMSFGKKMAIGAVFATAGLAASQGLVAAGAVASAVALRRAIMGAITGVGTAEKLSARGVKKTEEAIEKEKQAFLKSMEGLSEEEKYNLLKNRTWDVAIKDEERAIEDIKNKNLKDLSAGLAVGVFFSSGLASAVMGGAFHQVAEHTKGTWLGNFMSGAYHKVSDLFGGMPEQQSLDGAVVEVNDGTHYNPNNVYAGDHIRDLNGANGSSTPLTDSFENRNSAPVDVMKESAVPHNVELPKETMTVHKGSNFIATLKKEYLDKHRDEFIKLNPQMAKFNNDQIAFRLAKAYGDKHLDGHLPDLVKAGAKMTFDPKTMEVNFLKPGDASFYPEHAVHQAAGATKLADVPNLNIKDTMAVNLEDLSKSPVPVAEEMLSKSEAAKVVQGNIVEAKEDYVKAANEALLHPAGSDGPSMAQMEEMGRADKALQQGAEYIKNNSDFYPETTKQTIAIQRAIASNDRAFWSEIQDLEYDQAVAEKRIGSKLELIKKQFEKEYGTRHAFTPKDGETLKRWTMRVANRIMEKRYGIAS